MENANSVVFLCSRIDLPGGTERAIINTANLLQLNGHSVSIIILDETIESFYEVNEHIKIRQYALHFGLTSKGNPLTRKLAFRTHIRKLRKILLESEAKTIISTDYIFSIAAWLAAGMSNKKIFAWEHHHFHWLKKSGFWNYLFKKIYPSLTAVICLNETEAGLFKKMGCRTKVIPNFIAPGHQALLNKKILLTVGWLIERKGTDLIPGIAEKIFENNKDWQWHIIGSGVEKESLQRSLNLKGLDKQVRILEPVTPQLEEAYEASSIYIMLSRSECFPMVLLEAMSYGLPCISFDCATGPSFIINNQVDGILIETENTEAISNAIIELMDNEERRKEMGARAFENIKRFSPSGIYPLWAGLIS